jgi:hypothetical protein
MAVNGGAISRQPLAIRWITTNPRVNTPSFIFLFLPLNALLVVLGFEVRLPGSDLTFVCHGWTNHLQWLQRNQSLPCLPFSQAASGWQAVRCWFSCVINLNSITTVCHSLHRNISGLRNEASIFYLFLAFWCFVFPRICLTQSNSFTFHQLFVNFSNVQLYSIVEMEGLLPWNCYKAPSLSTGGEGKSLPAL